MSKPTFTCNERDELAHTLLHTLLCFFGDFGIFWESILHDPRDWSEVAYVSIKVVIFFGFIAFG